MSWKLGVLALLVVAATLSAQSSDLPHLRKHGTATELIVNGRPFLIRGGELGNSTASSLEYLAPYWSRFRALNLNTIVTPIYWDLMEPEEGRFDFTLLDGLVAEARKNNNLADGGTAAAPVSWPAGGLVIATGPDEFLFAGIGVTVTFVNGAWKNIRWLNGDQTHQGRHLRLEPGRFSTQRIKLYRYR